MPSIPGNRVLGTKSAHINFFHCPYSKILGLGPEVHSWLFVAYQILELKNMIIFRRSRLFDFEARYFIRTIIFLNSL
jgi:hypothetical protein